MDLDREVQQTVAIDLIGGRPQCWYLLVTYCNYKDLITSLGMLCDSSATFSTEPTPHFKSRAYGRVIAPCYRLGSFLALTPNQR